MTSIPDDAWKDLFNQDVIDLLNLVRSLEERIIKLEKISSRMNVVDMTDDLWYWDH